MYTIIGNIFFLKIYLSKKKKINEKILVICFKVIFYTYLCINYIRKKILII